MYIYQMYPHAFNSDNFFIKLASNMNYYSELGIEAILLCPITTSPFIDSGYDVEDYYSINPMFGTIEQFEQLIATAQNFNIKIMLDMVLNHTSDQHPWFQAAINGDSNYRDYYILRNGQQNLNNWVSGRTHQSVWSEYQPDKYYMHIYTPKQPDLNWDNPQVRFEMKNVLKFWTAMGVSGFRLDVINKIGKDWEHENEGLGPTNLADCKFHDIDKTFDYIKELTLDFDQTIFIGQVSGASHQSLNKYTAAGLDYCLNFNHVDLTKDGIYHKLEATHNDWINEINTLFEYPDNLVFFESHDLPRSINNFLDPEFQLESAQIIAILLLFNNHSSIIYQGQELGLINRNFSSINQFNDIRTIEYHNIRIANGENAENVFTDICAYSRDQARFNFDYIRNSIFYFYKWVLKLVKPLKTDKQNYELKIDNDIITLSYGFYIVIINLSEIAIDFELDNILFTNSLDNKLDSYQFVIYSKGQNALH